MDGNRHLTPASIQDSFQRVEESPTTEAFQRSRVCVGQIEFCVKRSEFELRWHESSHSLVTFNSTVEKRSKFERIQLERSRSWLSLIPYLNSSIFELMWLFRLLQLWISSSSSGVLQYWNLPGFDCIHDSRIYASIPLIFKQDLPE